MRWQILILIVVITGSLPAFGTACTNNLYPPSTGHLTCVSMSTFVGSATSCGSPNNSIVTITAGDYAIVWDDASASITGLTDNRSTTYTTLGNLSNTSFPGGGAGTHDVVFIGKVNTTGALNLTLACGAGSYEMVVIVIHSDTGTVNVNCSSNWVLSANPAPINTVTSASCTSTTSNGMALNINDFSNSQPSAAAGWSILEDSGSEWVFQSLTAGVTATGTVTGSVTNTSSEAVIVGTVVLDNGSSSSPPPGQFPRSQ
jgi:hypothetical protein